MSLSGEQLKKTAKTRSQQKNFMKKLRFELLSTI